MLQKTNDLRNKNKGNVITNAYWSLVGAAGAGIATMLPVFAVPAKTADLWSALKSFMNNVYSKIFGLTTLIAVLVATVALVMRMFSSNQKTVDTATQWLKRIVVSWIIINSMSFIVNYFSDYFANGKWTG